MVHVYVKELGKVVKLSDREFVASGGEASIYRMNRRALKIYHDRNRVIPRAKMYELRAITAPEVLVPQELVYDKDRCTPIGFQMDYVPGAVPLVKWFSAVYRKREGLTRERVHQLVTALQKLLIQVHRSGCLVVDLNEMNVLVAANESLPRLIDADSYQTPSFRATACSLAIMDPLTRAKGNFNVLSDWFSFAVLAFQLYTGVHPYKGAHPDYKPAEWLKRMQDGVSAFDARAAAPPSSAPLSVIPPYLSDWLRGVLEEGKREAPPNPRQMGSAPINHPVTRIKTAGGFSIFGEQQFPGEIRELFACRDGTYVTTPDEIYRNGKRLCAAEPGMRTYVTETDEGEPICAAWDGNNIHFSKPDGSRLGTAPADGVLWSEHAIHVLAEHHLIEHRFTRVTGRTLSRIRVAAHLAGASVEVMDGVAIKRMLGKLWIIYPYALGKAFSGAIPELDPYRILAARAKGRTIVGIGEQAGKYYRFVLLFERGFRSYKPRIDQTDYAEPNFAVLPNGVNAMLVEDGVLELFTSHDRLKRCELAPVDQSMRLYNCHGQVHVVTGNRLFGLSMSNQNQKPA